MPGKRSPVTTRSIVINNIRFILLAKTVSEKGYALVNVMSKYDDYDDTGLLIKKTQLFFVYKSFSEIGLWRLALQQSIISGFFKGRDYVQSSLIHLELQNFINECFDDLKHIDRLYDDRYVNSQMVPGVELVSNEQLTNSINSEERLVNISPFNEFAKTTSCGNMFKKTDEELRLEKKLEEPSPGIPPMIHRQPKKGFFSVEELDKLITDDTLKEFGNRVKEEYSIKDRKFMHIIPDFFVTSSHNDYGVKTGNYDYGVTVKNAELYKLSLTRNGGPGASDLTSIESIDLYYAEATILNKIQRKHSEFVNKEFLEKNSGATFFGDEIGQKDFMEKFEKIKTKDEAKELMRAYGKYYPRDEDKFCGADKRHYMPFLLTTNDAVCSPFGLYSKYVPAGVYICKMFDYRDQCTLNESKECSISGTDYTFIGNRYKNVFPFDVVKNMIKNTHDRTCRTHRRITAGPGEKWGQSLRRGGKKIKKRATKRAKK